jgi:phosphatidylserine/phosphatidylglycerophosphate/cardiolipin synthase-like enzyme
LLKSLFERAAAEDGTIHAALYELDDPELVALLLENSERLNLILSTAGSRDTKGKPTVWDTTNAEARAALREKLGERLQDRMFNNSAHIGHNKFVVLSVNDTSKAVWTGSTNWTPTGLCGQTNNAILVEDETFAHRYRDYWDRLHADQLPVPDPISAPNNTNQGAALRSGDAQRRRFTLASDGSHVELWYSPNTPTTGSSSNRTVPPDLEVVFRHMKAAKHAIFFLVFNPGRTPGGEDEDVNTVVSAALDFGRHQPGLLVKGAISDPTAVPGYVATPPGVAKPKPEDRIPQQAIYSPPGAPNVLMVRAAAIDDLVGDFEKELLTAGNAIIHDKVVVIDPLDEKNCVVITGSHNLGFKASYANDENLVIVKGNPGLAQAYAVHVLDVFDHFRFRAVLEEQKREDILARIEAEAIAERDGQPAPQPTHTSDAGRGYLSTEPDWQLPYFDGPKVGELDYFLGA